MRTSLKPFVIAGAIMAGAILLRLVLGAAVTGLPPFITIYPAVAVACLFCGPAPAAFASVAGVLAAMYFWLPPRMNLAVSDNTDRVSLLLFLAGAAVVVWASGELRSRLAEVSQAQDEQMSIQGELRREREWLRLALEAGALAVWDFDPRTGEAEIDTRYARTLGYGPETRMLSRGQIGSHIHPEDRPFVAARHDALVVSREPYEIEYRMITGTGEVRWVVSQGIFVGGDDTLPERMAGIIQDITERKQREEGLREVAAARELLIREADHRIKNSLQLVMSLLGVQLRGVKEPAAAEALREASARVSAIAASHLALQGSADLKSVDMAVTLRELCAHFAALQPAIDMTCRFEGDLTLDADRAIPLGLVVSEVLTNALRHAFAGRECGHVVVEAARIEGDLRVRIRDDGVGMPEGPGGGLGSRIMRALASQLGARIEVESRAGEGTVVTLRLAVA